MKQYCVILSLFFIQSAEPAFSQTVEVIKMDQLRQMLNPVTDTTYVINFWATWCKPCVKEMPYFEKLGKMYDDKKLKVVLVSLDFMRHLDTQLIPFVKKNRLSSRVLLLNEPDANLWIDLVDPSWSGAIPATIVINSSTGHKSFYEKEFTYIELDSIVKPLISE